MGSRGISTCLVNCFGLSRWPWHVLPLGSPHAGGAARAIDWPCPLGRTGKPACCSPLYGIGATQSRWHIAGRKLVPCLALCAGLWVVELVCLVFTLMAGWPHSADVINQENADSLPATCTMCSLAALFFIYSCRYMSGSSLGRLFPQVCM